MLFLNFDGEGPRGSRKLGGNVRMKVPIWASRSLNAVDSRTPAKPSVFVSRLRTNLLILRRRRMPARFISLCLIVDPCSQQTFHVETEAVRNGMMHEYVAALAVLRVLGDIAL